MVHWQRGHAEVGMLVIFATLIVSTGACTGSSGQPSSTRSAMATVRRASSAKPTPRICTGAEVKGAINGFFAAWNHRDAVALGQLFTPTGELDLATKYQDTLHKHVTASAGGLGARNLIAAFAKRQWRLGEKLLHRDTSAIVGSGGGPEGGGGGAVVVARFADGTVQRMVFAKFVYDCVNRGFSHVVLASAMTARHLARPWSWRMP